MNNKILIAFALILFLSLNVFAAAPTLSAITASPVYATDHNYSNWKPTDMVTLSALVTGADLNKDGCGYAINGSWTYPTAIDLNLDTNILSYTVNTITINDINWGLRCTNTSAETGYSFRTLYLDANAPSATITTSKNTATITCTDVATNTGNGSGVKGILYSVNGDGPTPVLGTNPLTITIPTGASTLGVQCVDNLDNASVEKDFSVTSYTDYNPVIPTLPLALLLLVPIILSAILMLALIGYMSATGQNVFPAMVTIIFTIIVIILIFYQIIS